MDTTSLDQPALAPAPDQVPRTPLAPVLDLVIPVHDEEKDLERAVRATRRYLDEHFPYPARLTIADNASTDGTWAIALRLAEEAPGVRLLHLDAKGRGRALRTAWTASDAAVLAYMDVDLSTDLSALLPLVAPLVSGHSHLAIGTRLSRSSRVLRGPRREVISRCYNVLLHGTLAARFSDAQCGFKAIRADAARWLLPLVSDTGWFFDTEPAGGGREGRAAHPRGAGGLGGRPGQPGGRGRDGARRPRRHRTAGARAWCPAACRWRRSGST